MGQARRRHFSAFFFPPCLSTAWPFLKTPAVPHKQSSDTWPIHKISAQFSLTEPLLIKIYDCQHSSCVLERPGLLETCSVEMQSSVLGRHLQLCNEKVLSWGLWSSMWPELVVLGWRKVILQHWSTLQCPLPPQEFSKEEYLLSVLGWYNTLVSTINWT